MKLLFELNEIQDKAANRRFTIEGWRIELNEWDATHGFYAGQMTYPQTHWEPAEYSDDESASLEIGEISFILNKGDEDYVAHYNFNDEDFHHDARKLQNALATSVPHVSDEHDTQVTDNAKINLMKRLISEYSKHFKLLDYLYANSPTKEKEAPDNGPDHYSWED